MNEQIRAILWAQFRTIRNYLPRTGWGTILTALLSAMWYGVFVSIAVSIGLAIPDVPVATLELLFPIGLLAVLLFWQIFPVMTLSSGWSLELSKLLVYPIRQGALFGVEVLLRLTTAPEMIIVLLGALVGLLTLTRLQAIAYAALLLPLAVTGLGRRRVRLGWIALSAVSAFAAFVRFMMSLLYFHRMMSSRGMLWNVVVPIDVAVPGSAVPIPAEKDKDKLLLDVLGVVRDEQGRPVGRIRQTMQLPPGSTGTVGSRQILYQSAVTLPPGRFSVKVVVRENTSGLMGSFEAPVLVPELKQAPLKVSSVLLSTQVQPAKESKDNPLIRNGEQMIPNLTHIVGKDQKMTFYYEVYDPAAGDTAVPAVRTSLAFYRGKVKVFETPVIERDRVDDVQRKAAVFRLELAPGSLPPGLYTCQVNIIDSVSQKFAFPRLLFLLR